MPIFCMLLTQQCSTNTGQRRYNHRVGRKEFTQNWHIDGKPQAFVRATSSSLSVSFLFFSGSECRQRWWRRQQRSSYYQTYNFVEPPIFIVDDFYPDFRLSVFGPDLFISSTDNNFFNALNATLLQQDSFRSVWRFLLKFVYHWKEHETFYDRIAVVVS